MSSWDICVDFFSNGIIPYSEYVWMITIVVVSAIGFVAARKMVRML